MADYGNLLDDTMWFLTSLQEDPNIQKIEEELHVKQKRRGEILVAIKTLPFLHKLASIIEGKNLQKKIDDLRRKEQILWERT